MGGHSECMAILLPDSDEEVIDNALYFVASLSDETDDKSRCLQLLSCYDASSDAALCVAACNDDLAGMAFLIDLGADPQAALTTAAREGHGRCLEYLLQQGAQERAAALKIATECGHDQCRQILMKHSPQTQTGCTIL